MDMIDRVNTTGKLLALVCLLALAAAGCQRPPGTADTATAPAPGRTPGPLPDAAFKLRAGQKEVVQVHIKNASDVFWWARGGEINERNDNFFYVAAGNRWLKADGTLHTDSDGRYGISKDLKPGEETEVPLLVTAPTEPGDYTLEVDLVQEQVSWFSDKGSPTAKAKVTVVR
jgi:hypothetical protein